MMLSTLKIKEQIKQKLCLKIDKLNKKEGLKVKTIVTRYNIIKTFFKRIKEFNTNKISYINRTFNRNNKIPN